MIEPNQKIRFVLIQAIVLILLASALLKLVVHGSDQKRLQMPHPLFSFVSIRVVQTASAVGELVIVGVLLKVREVRWAGSLLMAWLCGVFLLYNLGIYLLHADNACQCFGSILSYLGVSPQDQRIFHGVTLGILIASTTGLLILDYRSARPCKESGERPLAP